MRWYMFGIFMRITGKTFPISFSFNGDTICNGFYFAHREGRQCDPGIIQNLEQTRIMWISRGQLRNLQRLELDSNKETYKLHFLYSPHSVECSQYS